MISSSTCQRFKIKRRGGHGEFAIGITRPFGRSAVPIQLDAALIGIAQIKGLAHAVIGRAVNRDARCHKPTLRISELCAIRIECGGVKQPRAAARRRVAAETLPSVQSDVMMIAARRDESGLLSISPRELKAEHAAGKLKRALEIGHPQVNVADADAGMDGSAHDIAG